MESEREREVWIVVITINWERGMECGCYNPLGVGVERGMTRQRAVCE